MTISCNPQALITGTLSFQSTNNLKVDYAGKPFEEYTGGIDYIFDDAQVKYDLVKYWNSGATDVESFTFSLNQGVTPVFLNDGNETPTYIRAGALQVSLSVVAWKDWLDVKAVKLGDKTLEILSGAKESMEFSHGGLTDTGNHTYNFKGYSEDDSSTEFFKIT